MAENRNPFEIFNNMPRFDDDFLREMTGMDWPTDPAGVLKHLGRSQWPPLDLLETTDRIIVILEIPGLQAADDVKLELKGETLKIEGEAASAVHISQDVIVHKQECRKGKFSRTVTLPAAVRKGARAAYRQGILEIQLLKLPDSQVERLNVEFAK